MNFVEWCKICILIFRLESIMANKDLIWKKGVGLRVVDLPGLLFAKSNSWLYNLRGFVKIELIKICNLVFVPIVTNMPLQFSVISVFLYSLNEAYARPFITYVDKLEKCVCLIWVLQGSPLLIFIIVRSDHQLHLIMAMKLSKFTLLN